jgi:DNA-binding NtrC family response regulator
MTIARKETVLLLVRDEEAVTRARAALRAPGRQVVAMPTAREGLGLLAEVLPDLIVAELELQDLSGARLIQALVQRVPTVPVVALTRLASMEVGVAAIRAGATDVLPLPLNRALLHDAAERALTEGRASRELVQAKEQLRDRNGLSRILSRSPRMLTVFDQIRAVAHTDATVLIRGETGTGKELISRAIHERSKRQSQPFVSVNCGAFTESLLESELFGHEKGSFTGAMGRRRGVFEMADGGTLFLDELGETSLNVQVTLLRVLEEMRFRRVGGQDLVPVDVRIVAATNVNLEQAVESGAFRQDLYYRLNVFPILLPPLRDRPEDIPLLARQFLEDAAEAYGVQTPTLSPEVLNLVCRFQWPGNVRQLRALCERWVIIGHGREIGLSDLPPETTGAAPAPSPAALALDPDLSLKAAVEQATASVEQAVLQRLLRVHEGHLSHTAEAAGITRRTLYTKMNQHGLDAKDFRRG